MDLLNIKVAEAFESATNPRGKDFEGPTFDELLASVKEKGVLVPVIARPKKSGDKLYEIVAGNRRFRAAKMAGLEEIPARVEEMTDEQAREVQIIENLQREDIHPIEEGQAYRQLVEKSKYSIAEIAQRVGKSENYVRYRLFLTNLTDKAASAFRKGKITDGHAVLIAKLSVNDQAAALKYVVEDGWGGATTSVKDLKEWIEKTFYSQLDNQPWLNSKEANEAVGKCKECQPNRNSLFGEVKEGACTDLKCWSRKMKAYINYVAERENTLLLVSKEYGTPETKGVIGRSEYETLSTNKKKQCEHAEKAVVAEGPDQGTVIWVCVDKKCKQHGNQHSTYELSPEEKENRKKEREKELKKKEKEEKKITAALENIKWPVSKTELEILFELITNKYGVNEFRPIGKRHNWEPMKKENRADWTDTLKKYATEMDEQQKFRLIIEIMLESTWHKDRILKLIEKGV